MIPALQPEPPAGAGRLKLAIYVNYFLFAGLLNSVGIVILQVQRNFGVSPAQASVLEACKDLSIAVVSFLGAVFLARLGNRRSMLLALGVIGSTCALIPAVPGFAATKLLFVATGLCFGVMKISVLSSLGLVAREPGAHASLMSFLESCFMVGIVSSYFLFGAFIDDAAPASTGWFRIYYVLAALAAMAFALLWSVPPAAMDAPACAPGQTSAGFGAMLRLALSPLVRLFVAAIFAYVLIEQAIMSWLPSFNSQVLHLPAALSVQMAAILAASTALGRFLAGYLLRRFSWFAIVQFSIGAAGCLVLATFPLTSAAAARGVATTGWGNAPLAAYVFPLIGLCLAPIYPVLNSVVLSSLTQAQHRLMAGLIVIFSALGGTLGSLLTGRLFEAYGGRIAFGCSLVPLFCLGLTLFVIRRRAAASDR